VAVEIFGLDGDIQKLEAILAKLDMKLSELSSDLKGGGGKTLSDIDSKLADLRGALDSVGTDALRIKTVTG